MLKKLVLADSEADARQKVTDAYLKHGYSKGELKDLEVWEVTKEPFKYALDVLEIWE